MPESRRQPHGGLKYPNPYLPAVLAALATFIVYLPSIGFDFLNWDDPGYVTTNPYLGSLGTWVFTRTFMANWHPLTMLSLYADHAIWGLDPTGYHLTNVVLHAANTALVVLVTASLITAFGKTRGHGPPERDPTLVSLTAGLLFGLHPLHVESVAWISERKDVLCAFFFLLSIISYIAYAQERPATRRSRGLYAASLVSFVLSLLSKPMAVTLPAVLLIIDFFPLQRLERQRPLRGVIIEKIPFFALAAAMAAVTLRTQEFSITPADVLGPGTRLLTALRAYAFYIYKTLLPVGLAPFYPHPINIDLLSAGTLGSIALLAVITIFCAITLIRRQRLYSAAWLYFILTLLPVIGIVQVGTQAAADRYTYLPGVVASVLAGLCVGRIMEKYGAPSAAICLLVLSVLLGALTMKQAAIWRESLALWSYEIEYLERKPGYSQSRTIIKDGEKKEYMPWIVMAYYNRAKAYNRLGRHRTAIEDYDRAIKINPGYSRAYLSRGSSYASLGEYEQAVKDFTTAIILAPDDPRGYQNRARAYSLLGLDELAARDLAGAKGLRR